MNHEINRLIHFALSHSMIAKEDEDYAANLILDVMQGDQFEKEEIDEELEECTPILENLLDIACTKGIIENTTTERDLLDTRIMNCVMPRPSEVLYRFNEDKVSKGIEYAMNRYYDLSIHSNYIRKSRVDKNIKWETPTRYGTIEISINLSKPEKDPKEIAKAKLVASTDYPKCLLCKENVGFAGNFNKPARQNHRILPFTLNNHAYYFQYSPYVYYNEHCIVFNEDHVPMKINRDTFSRLLSFVNQVPHYFLGSNADLPIVGGSILSHDHFQGGHYHFPIENAKVLGNYIFEKYPHIQMSMIEWPLSTLRLESDSCGELVNLADEILKAWKNYSDPTVAILSYTNEEHNTITPIARKVGDKYQLDLVLRNNRCNEDYPDGIFHPHQDVHHIKKENIGLIEVMGLAILPARLKTEMEKMIPVLLKETTTIDPILEKHQDWLHEIMNKHVYTKENVRDYLQEEIGHVFERVLEDAGVYKMNAEGIEAFKRFIKTIGGKEV